jgi:DNA-binding transcriptional LysR family regulator
MLITENILSHLNYFWQVARHLSFTKAAQALRISQSAVSLQVKTLEEKLETQLFLRYSKNQVALSPAGQRLAERCRTIFQEVDVALSEIESEEIKGTLVVSTAVTFGSLVVVPFLRILEAQYPLLKVELEISDALACFGGPVTQTDLAIRWGATDDPRLNYELLIYENFAIVASPEYLRKAIPLKTPKDLEEHTVIIRRTDHPDWQLWLESLPKSKQPKLRKTKIINNTFGMIEATKAGMGVSIFSQYAINKLLQEKQIKRILPKYPCPPGPIHICYPKTPYPQPRIAAFVKALQEYLRTQYGKGVFESLDEI